MKLPLLRPAALRCAIALQLGVTEDELSEAGIPISVPQDILWKDDQDIDSACPNFTDHEFAIVSKLSGILAFLHRTDVYLDMEYQYFMDLMRRWLAGHGIELEIVPRKLFP